MSTMSNSNIPSTSPISRVTRYDLLRIFAAFSVVMLHSSARYWYTLPVDSFSWMVTNAWDAVSRFGVPVFVMLSGALFLSPEKKLNLKRLWKHNILRLLIIWVIWNCFYGVAGYFLKRPDFFSVKELVRCMINGHYHLWFLPMIICIYALLPILKKWTINSEKKELEYLLLLLLLFQILLNTALCFIRTPEIHEFFSGFYLEPVCSYTGYFLLGYYLQTYGLPDRLKKILWLLQPFCIIANILISTFQSRIYGAPDGTIYDSFGLFTFLIVCGIYTFFTDTLSSHSFHPASSRIISEISKDTLGIYVMHLLFLEWNNPVYCAIYPLPVLISVPLMACCAFTVSLLLAAVLRRIPFIGRYIC